MIVDGGAIDAALHGTVTDPRRYLARFGYAPPPLDQVAAGVRPIAAEVNAGRWIWQCPCGAFGPDGTLGGGVVFADSPIGWCPACSNAETDGAWRPLALPSERDAIERLLDLRPDPDTRNWWPGETLADLERENAEHDLAELTA